MPGRMRWGMVGGALGSRLASARVVACIDCLFEFSAGAVDIDPAKSRADGMGPACPKIGPTAHGAKCSMRKSSDPIASTS